MDTYCNKCNEPWDTYEVHEAKRDAQGYGQEWVLKGMAVLECPCCLGKKLEPQPKTGELSRGEAATLCADLFGDDLDGVASMMDDAIYLGIIK